jgi:BirA family biotin operon repressor/biotin-[acetyl-CoA-carboxylase] ligase
MFFDSIDSTNTFAMDLLSKTNPQHGLCIFTDFQTVGRGQIGRSWISNFGENLLASWILHHQNFDIENAFYLSMSVGLALNDTFRELGVDSTIKWPNDIYIDNKKIAGILIQNVLRNNIIKSSVVGIGLNINQIEFPDILTHATSLRLIEDRLWDRDVIRNLCGKMIIKRHKELSASDFERLKVEYIQNLYLLDQYHEFTQLDKTKLYAKIKDVASDGKLLMEDASGNRHQFDIKEIIF